MGGGRIGIPLGLMWVKWLAAGTTEAHNNYHMQYSRARQSHKCIKWLNGPGGMPSVGKSMQIRTGNVRPIPVFRADGKWCEIIWWWMDPIIAFRVYLYNLRT